MIYYIQTLTLREEAPPLTLNISIDLARVGFQRIVQTMAATGCEERWLSRVALKYEPTSHSELMVLAFALALSERCFESVADQPAICPLIQLPALDQDIKITQTATTLTEFLSPEETFTATLIGFSIEKEE